MDGSSWSIRSSTPAGAHRQFLLRCGTFPFFGNGPADVVGWNLAKAQDTESLDRRVMVTPNTDGEAYTLQEFIEFFRDRSTASSEWEKAVPVALFHQRQRQAPWLGSRRVATDKSESNDEFLNNKKAFMGLVDEDGVAVAPRRRRVTNAKLLRRALMWSRFVKKCLLFLRNDPTGRLCSPAGALRSAREVGRCCRG